MTSITDAEVTVNKVDKLEDIISNFINDPYKGRIPIDELQEVYPVEDVEDNEYPKSYTTHK
ncbi:hypothetical protein [Candidatus Tisiphia endosymbiont of Ditula angustiorana]|uniref:hypothetical protein n=1 Tax=Candidatus Tisiphia endosymbiont of Ditula angustiorana TaxID=3066272 RepID=UPI00312C7404